MKKCQGMITRSSMKARSTRERGIEGETGRKKYRGKGLHKQALKRKDG
jgi:hypothetical protein